MHSRSIHIIAYSKIFSYIMTDWYVIVYIYVCVYVGVCACVYIYMHICDGGGLVAKPCLTHNPMAK